LLAFYSYVFEQNMPAVSLELFLGKIDHLPPPMK
jgi:hypothetical protein